MRKALNFPVSSALLILAAATCIFAGSDARHAARQSAGAQNQTQAQSGATPSSAPAKTSSAASPRPAQTPADSGPPTDAEIRSRAQLLISNQHHDDLALMEFERIERQETLSGGAAPRIVEDKTYRVVPTGLGTYRILLKTGDKPVPPADYRRQLQNWAAALQLAMNPDDPRTQSIAEKFQKKNRDRANLVDAARTAFIPKWLQTEIFHGRLCDVLELDPNPDFHPRNLSEEAMTHVTGKVWVDHASNQMARGEARVIRDIPVGGGILGKVYRGSAFSLEQAEVVPGIWLPTRYEYDYSGRKFLFVFAEHQVIEASGYRRVGPPQHALAMVRAELASGETSVPDP